MLRNFVFRCWLDKECEQFLLQNAQEGHTHDYCVPEIFGK